MAELSPIIVAAVVGGTFFLGFVVGLILGRNTMWSRLRRVALNEGLNVEMRTKVFGR